MLGQTIAAVATPPGVGGIGVIRISGPTAKDVLARVFRPAGGSGEFSPRHMYLGRVVSSKGEALDQALAVYMPGPRSYTGEDVAELQCHGGYVVCREVLAAVLAAGAVLAEPGEFTARAFINGKLSLDQAEAVVDLIEAKCAAALRIAERQLDGSLQREIAALTDRLLDLLAELELLIDYPDEAAEPPAERLRAELDAARREVERLLAQAREGRLYREGALTAIVGPANAGKSTLLNALLEEERSIVTPVPGTTRDTVEEYYVLGGLPLRLVDTAGIRETDDVVEMAGIERSRRALAAADLILLVLDATAPPDAFWRELIAANAARPLLLLLNKCDAAPTEKLTAELAEIVPGVPILPISAQQGQGLDELRRAARELLLAGGGGEELAGLINERQRAALAAAANALAAAAETLAAGFDAELLSVDLQTAWQSLAEISGQAAADDIIERVFSRFCLGK